MTQNADLSSFSPPNTIIIVWTRWSELVVMRWKELWRDAKRMMQEVTTKPARVPSLTMVNISRALDAIPGEFRALLGQKSWKKDRWRPIAGLVELYWIESKRARCDGRLLQALRSLTSISRSRAMGSTLALRIVRFMIAAGPLLHLGHRNSFGWAQQSLQWHFYPTVNVLPTALTMQRPDSRVGETDVALSWKATQIMSTVFLFLPMGRFWHRQAGSDQSVCGSLTTKATDFWKGTTEE